MASTTTQKGGMNTGVRKKLQFRDTRQGVLPNTIDAFSRLTVDPATKAALTSAGARLTVEIDTAGTRVFLADQRTGQLIGGPEDLARLGGIRSFVNRERKDAHGVEIAREVTQLAYKAAQEASLIDKGYKQVPLEASYGAAVRPLMSIVDTINDNEKKLQENTNPELREVFKYELETFFEKIRQAYFQVILLHTKGENTKGKLKELLFSVGVPDYVHSRLTNRTLVLDRSQELARVLFPSDPSKGLTLTYEEWRSSVFREKLGKTILGASSLVCELINNDEFIRSITKIDASIDLDDETNPSVAKLLKCRIGVLPPMEECRYVIEPASKTRAGWKFPSPSMDSIQGAMSAFSTSVLRMYSANLQSVDLVGDYYATLVPGSVSRAAVSPTNNFYVQWGAAPDPKSLWLDHIHGGGNGSARSNVWRWLRTEMRLSEKGEAGKALANALFLKENGSPDPDAVKDGDSYESLTRASTRARSHSLPDKGKIKLMRDLTPVEIPLWQKFQKDTFPSRKKGKKVVASMGNTLTKLTTQGLALVEEIDKLSPFIAERMRQWLRGFSDERVQRAAVKLANASFDELFIQESQDSDDASDSDESDDED